MEVRNGFIVGISDYCERWCETCALTSWCGLFADIAAAEAALDPSLKALIEAPPLPQDVPPAPSTWVLKLIDETNESASEPLSDEECGQGRLTVAPEHAAILARGYAYCDRVSAWLQGRDGFSLNDRGDPCAVVGVFRTLIPGKIFRALAMLKRETPEEHGWPADYEGSAKVALLGVERSHVAWLHMADRGLATSAEAARFIADLVWLGEALERVFPHARAFVRPAFDEPDEVARMLEVERQRR
jgi:hypothetical protein